VCDLETSRMGAPYIYDISRLRVKRPQFSSANSRYYIILVLSLGVCSC